MNDRTVSVTVHVSPEKRLAFNEYARSIGISPGNLIRNFIYSTVAQNSKVEDKAA